MTDLTAPRLAMFALIVCDADNTLHAVYQCHDKRRLQRIARGWSKAGHTVAVLSRRQTALRGIA